MSELIQKRDDRATMRWKFLTGASVLALTAYIAYAPPAKAEDVSQPQIWIGLGGQLDRLDIGQEEFAPHFFDTLVQNGFISPLTIERPAQFSLGEEGSISFQPQDSDWIFTGAINYGRSSGKRIFHQQAVLKSSFVALHSNYYTKSIPRYEQITTQNSESHMILDFSAGKDVGLGLFGKGMSTISAGVRFAQFNERSSGSIYALPDGKFVVKTIDFLGKYFHVPFPSYHHYAASLSRATSFKGVGPSLSWKASLPLLKSASDEQISLDWGLNAAILFGKQKAKTHHKSVEFYYHTSGTTGQLPTREGGGTRSRSVTVPNLGGFAGLSMRYSNAKISFGYRGDFFFGAMDGGIDAAKKENVGFYGPFATVSIGLGG